MSTSLGRALRTALTLACALAALAVVAGPAMAEELLPETGEPPELAILGLAFEEADNEYQIDLGNELSVRLGIEVTGITPGLGALPGGIFCPPAPGEAGIYAVIGLLTEPWRPSEEAPPGNRKTGLAVWANETGSAEVPVTPLGCAGPKAPYPGQVAFAIEDAEPAFVEFLYETTLEFCQAGDEYVLTGDGIGPRGEDITYLVPSATGVWHLYTLGAFGAVQESNEEVVNLRFDGFDPESEPCPELDV